MSRREREKVPCPSCGKPKLRSSGLCRSCNLEQLKRETFPACHRKEPQAILPFWTPFRPGKKYRSM